jgi:hypothetical protein
MSVNKPDPPPLDTVRVNNDDSPKTVVAKVNALLTPYGLQLKAENTENERHLLCSCHNYVSDVDNETGTLEDQLNCHALGYRAAVRASWDGIPEDMRKPEELVRTAFQEGAAMARVVIESHLNVARALIDGHDDSSFLSRLRRVMPALEGRSMGDVTKSRP